MQLLKFGFILALTLAATAASAGQYSKDQVLAHCSQKWDTQYDMVKYCTDSQFKGYTDYSRLRSDLPTFHKYFNYCEKKWGTQWDMVSHCAENQVDGINTIMKETETLPPKAAMNILGTCSEKWPDQLDMQAYCATKQAGAWRALNQ
jgi:hypothetical protein